MDIGTGIALLGVWLFPTASMLGSTITGGGVVLAMVAAMATTAFIILM